MAITARPGELEGLHLFKSLIKDGCYWQGDIVSKRWSERLNPGDDPIVAERVARTLAVWERGEHYEIRDGWIFIA